jgi:hypothetical protein
MAKIVEEVVVIKVSQLVKDEADAETKLTDEVIAGLEQIASELVGDGSVVEVIKG